MRVMLHQAFTGYDIIRALGRALERQDTPELSWRYDHLGADITYSFSKGGAPLVQVAETIVAQARPKAQSRTFFRRPAEPPLAWTVIRLKPLLLRDKYTEIELAYDQIEPGFEGKIVMGPLGPFTNGLLEAFYEELTGTSSKKEVAA